MKVFKYILTFILVVFSSSLFAQNEKVEIETLIEQGKEASYTNLDSSLMIFKSALELSIKANDETNEANVLGEIGKIYYFMNDIAIAIEYFQKSLNLSLKIEYYVQVAKMCNNIGLMNLYTQEYDTAFVFFTKQLEYSIRAGDSIWLSDGYNNFGSYYLEKEMLDSALVNYEKSLKIAEEIDFKENIATANTNIAIVYHSKGNLPLCLKYYLDAATIFEEINDFHNLTVTLGNVGALYLDNEEFDKAKDYLIEVNKMRDTIFIEDYYLKLHLINLGIVYSYFEEYDEAENVFSEALQISLSDEDVKSQIIVYINFVDLYIEKNENAKALEYANLASKLSEEIESERYIAKSYKKLGKVYNVLKNYNKAIYYLKIAYTKSVDNGYLVYVIDILSELKFAYSNIYDYKNAFETDELIIVFQDSLTGIETQKQLATLTTIYETEKKEQEIERQKLEIIAHKAENEAKDLKIKHSNIITMSVSIVLVLAILLTIVLLRLIRTKKKANIILANQKAVIEQKNEELGQLLEEVSSQKELIEFQRDVANEQKAEIIASINYAQRIQKAVLPSKEFAEKILPEHFILFKPQNIVSGDFYWMKQIRSLVIVATADCTGHGVPGAFMSMLGSAFLNDIVNDKNIESTGKILNHLRDKIKISLKQIGEDEEQKDGMDIAFYAIDKDSFEIQFSGAYNSLYIIRDVDNVENNDQKHIKYFTDEKTSNKTIIELKADRQPVAIHVVEKDFETRYFQLQKNDCLYTFSDGFADQFGGEEGASLKTRNFKKLLLSIADKSMQEQRSSLDNFFENWRGDREQIDDVLVIGVRI